MKQIVLVCGGRDYEDRLRLYAILDVAHRANPIIRLVHGAARGADTLAEDWASERGIIVKAYPADWQRDGKAAGPIRNRRMLEQEKPHMIIAFPGGKGTADMIRQAEAANVPVVRVRPRAPQN